MRGELRATPGHDTEASDGQLSLRLWLADGEEGPGLGALL